MNKDFVLLYEYGHARKTSARKWPAYIAKVGHKWYPNESISEHLFTRIGQVLGFDMAASKLMRADGQIRFLSKYFLGDEESLVHGAEIFAGYLEDENFVQDVESEDMSRELFTFQFVRDAIGNQFSEDQNEILRCFVRMLAFDAIIGNNDRHYYNWGVIVHARGLRRPRFSPIYDSARALFWNEREGKIEGLSQNLEQKARFLRKYVKESYPKTGWTGIKKPNHFRLISNIAQTYPEFRTLLLDLYPSDALKIVTDVLNREFATLMSTARRALILECLAQRLDGYHSALEEA